MNAFTFERLAHATDAASALAARPGAMFLAGGTTVVDLMKVDVLTPDTVVAIRPLGLSSIDVSDDAISVGAAVTNSQVAWHPAVRDRFPVLAQAILSGATTQIRNMATVAGTCAAPNPSAAVIAAANAIRLARSIIAHLLLGFAAARGRAGLPRTRAPA
jgi:CO/xanthine dehydrogenase FAD-binding subunit